MQQIGDGIWWWDTGTPGPRVGISFGVHGNERAPIDAGLQLVEELRAGQHAAGAGAVLLMHANPRATKDDARWSNGGVDLNRCFHPDVMGRDPELFEEHRAHEIADALESRGIEALLDFHCTVEPGERFMMHHPPIADPGHKRATDLLAANVVLADPALNFGGVSLDEWMSTRGRVGVCYETGWMGDPATTPEAVHAEMINVLRGYGVIEGSAQAFADKRAIELDRVVKCEGEGFQWREGIGQNLQELPAGQVLGAYADGTEVTLDAEATLIFPKKKPELVEMGMPLVLLASRK